MQGGHQISICNYVTEIIANTKPNFSTQPRQITTLNFSTQALQSIANTTLIFSTQPFQRNAYRILNFIRSNFRQSIATTTLNFSNWIEMKTFQKKYCKYHIKFQYATTSKYSKYHTKFQYATTSKHCKYYTKFQYAATSKY